jgi:hypothetical protein
MLNDAMSFLDDLGALEAIGGFIMAVLAIAIFNYFFRKS